MVRSTRHGPPEGDDDNAGLIATIAELYYKDGLTQQDIARRMGVSRATIINHLKQGRDNGIVDIRISGSAYSGSDLSRDLAAKYGLTDVYVTRTEFKASEEQAHQSVARLGATALSGLIQNGDNIGVAWGRTIQRVAAFMPPVKRTDLHVVQMVGSINSRELLTSEASAIRLAERLNATCRTLHAPAVLSSAALAAQLRAEPVVRDQLDRFANLTKAIFSVGDVGKGSVVLESGMATQDELTALKDRNASAVLCGYVIDAEGAHLTGDYSDRVIGIEPAELSRIPVRICVASRHHKQGAVLAALRGGYVTHLVIDEQLAAGL